MARILLVDDEHLLVKGLKRSLEQEGHEVTAVYDGEAALEAVATWMPDLILLDIMLPKIDGLEVCRLVRSRYDVPVIMLTAKGDDVDKIVGLELGADDYMSKPFNTRELIARIKAVLRRYKNIPLAAGGNRIVAGDLLIDEEKRKVKAGEKDVNLTAREFDLLLLFARHPGRVYTRDNLLELIWGSAYYSDPRTVDVCIRRLREKIEKNPDDPKLIMTKWGVGYYFQETF